MVKSTRKRHSRKHGKGDARRLFVRRAKDMPSQLAVLREAVSSFGHLAPHSMKRAARTALRGPGEYAVLGKHGSPRGHLDTFEDAWDLARDGDVRADSDSTHSEPKYGVFKADPKKQTRRKRHTRSKGGKGSTMREAARLRRNLGPGRGTKRKRLPSPEKRRTRRRHSGSLTAAMKRLQVRG